MPAEALGNFLVALGDLLRAFGLDDAPGIPEMPGLPGIPRSASVLAPLDLATLWPAVNKIAKADEDRGHVFAWANISVDKSGDELVDLHGDSIDPETLEDAVYEHVLMFRSAGVDHAGESVGRLIESFMVTPDKLESMGLAKDALPIGWWTGWKVDDPEVFQKIKSGEYTMMSIQGTAVPEMVDE